MLNVKMSSMRFYSIVEKKREIEKKTIYLSKLTTSPISSFSFLNIKLFPFFFFENLFSKRKIELFSYMYNFKYMIYNILGHSNI